MTEFENQTTDNARNPRALRKGLATGATVALLALGTAAAAIASGGGVGTGGGGNGGNDSDNGSRTGDRFAQEWDSFRQKDKKWARKTSECESGGDPNVHGSGGLYHGAFQFHADTWRSSPMSPGGKHADNYSWKVQAVVAVKLMKRDGKGHWPVCG
ncbi:MAG TPA: transglycosylase family protein [Solirubrobacterales bacterium]|nr:transglycosylase family protein [Solirubrobacterales bacterium]